jgi:hypothetical protein
MKPCSRRPHPPRRIADFPHHVPALNMYAKHGRVSCDRRCSSIRPRGRLGLARRSSSGRSRSSRGSRHCARSRRSPAGTCTTSTTTTPRPRRLAGRSDPLLPSEQIDGRPNRVKLLPVVQHFFQLIFQLPILTHQALQLVLRAAQMVLHRVRVRFELCKSLLLRLQTIHHVCVGPRRSVHCGQCPRELCLNGGQLLFALLQRVDKTLVFVLRPY